MLRNYTLYRVYSVINRKKDYRIEGAAVMVCIGIIGAMEQEVSALIRQMKDMDMKSIANMDFYRGNLWGQDVVVVKSGVGKVNVAICTQILVNIYEVDMLINTGIAGGLLPDIHPGDIVISSDAVQHDVDVTGRGFEPGEIPFMETSVFKADPELIDMAQEACRIVNEEIGCFVGRVVTGDQFISDNKVRSRIRDVFGAACTEMEGAAMAQVAYLNKIPFVIIRAISDNADDKASATQEKFEEQAVIHTVKLLAAMFLKMSR